MLMTTLLETTLTRRNLINARLSPYSHVYSGEQKMETTSKIYRVSNPAWGGDAIFHSAGLLFRSDLFISCQQSHMRASSAMRTGGLA